MYFVDNVQWLIKAIREFIFILFPQYNILFPQNTFFCSQKKDILFPLTILFPQHIILFPQYIFNTNKLSPSTEATHLIRPDFKCTEIVKY